MPRANTKKDTVLHKELGIFSLGCKVINLDIFLSLISKRVRGKESGTGLTCPASKGKFSHSPRNVSICKLMLPFLVVDVFICQR